MMMKQLFAKMTISTCVDDPNRVAINEIGEDGKTISRVVGSRKAHQLLFQAAANCDVIDSQIETLPGGEKYTAIRIFDRAHFCEVQASYKDGEHDGN